MSAQTPHPARFQMAPVSAAGAVWDDAVVLVLAPIRLSKPVHVRLPGSRSRR